MMKEGTQTLVDVATCNTNKEPRSFMKVCPLLVCYYYSYLSHVSYSSEYLL